ncbi:MAG: WD40 repeat domain-containing protein [Crinalium sp.]
MNYLKNVDEVVKNLANHPNPVRIKKLVVFACTRIWVTDAVQLKSMSLKDLVCDLRELHPTLANLQQALYELANKLNKPTEYLLIAKMISREMEKLYRNDTQVTGSSIVNSNELEDFQYPFKDYVKLAVLELEENQFAQVLKVTVEIIDRNNTTKAKTVSYLPSTFKAIEFYYAFKVSYNRLFINYKKQGFLGEVTNAERNPHLPKSYQSIEWLKRSLSKWFSSPEFSEIRNTLLQELDPNEEIQMIIHSPNQHLLQLPWYLVFEPFLKNYTQTEIAFRINKKQIYSTKSVFIDEIKVVAILGNYGSIDIEAEEQEIAAIPNSELLLLTEPLRQQLDNIWHQNWNILFFSSSYGDRFEDIYFNQFESLTIEEFKSFLKRAIASGLEIAIINCSNGLEIAGKLADLEIPNLIILREHVPPRVAQGFLKLFLKACASGKSVYMAIREAREKLAPIETIFPGATWLPVIFQNSVTEAVRLPEIPPRDHTENLEEEDWSEPTITKSQSLQINNYRIDENYLSPQLNQKIFYTKISLGKIISGFDSEIYTVAITPDGQKIVGGSGDIEHEDDAIKIWDIDTGSLIDSLKGHQHWIYAVAITPDGKKIVSGSFDNNIKIWDFNTNTIKPSTIEAYDRVNAIAISPDGKIIVSGSDDDTAKIWNLETGALIKTLKSHSRRVNSVAISPDGQTIITGSDDQTIKIWYLATGSLIDTLISHTKPVLCVVITPDGKNIISSSGDQTIKIWNLATGTLMATLTGHKKSVLAIAISPDGHTIISSSLDKTIKVWDFTTGSLINTLSGHKDIILSVAISPDGRKIVSSSYGEIRVWEVAELTRLR